MEIPQSLKPEMSDKPAKSGRLRSGLLALSGLLIATAFSACVAVNAPAITTPSPASPQVIPVTLTPAASRTQLSHDMTNTAFAVQAATESALVRLDARNTAAVMDETYAAVDATATVIALTPTSEPVVSFSDSGFCDEAYALADGSVLVVESGQAVQYSGDGEAASLWRGSLPATVPQRDVAVVFTNGNQMACRP